MMEIEKRRQKEELNYLIKDGAVPVVRRSDFLDWNYMAELKAFSSRIGETFNLNRLTTALTTESHVVAEIEKQKELGIDTNVQFESNKNLSVKGAELIETVVAGWLRAALPDFPEEGVQAVVGYLTCEDMLAEVAFHIGTRDLVLTKDYPPNKETLSQVFQAVVAALSETDPVRAEKLVLDVVAAQLAGKDLNEIWDVINPMGVLCQVLENRGVGPPESRLLWRSGPKTILACYHVGIYSDKEILGQSSGETVEIAEEMAARDALRQLFNTSPSMSPLPLGQRATLETKSDPNMSVTIERATKTERVKFKKPTRLITWASNANPLATKSEKNM